MSSRLCEKCGEPIPEARRKDAKYCSHKCGEHTRKKRHYDLNPELYKSKREKANLKLQDRIFTRVKSRCKQKGIPFDLTLEDIIIPTHCPVLGMELIVGKGTGGWIYSSPSLDRIRPHLGYTKGNVRVICARANLLKSDATIEELEKVLEDLRRIL
jgi:hypothetical protein